MFGFKLDKAKHVRAQISAPFLGVITDFTWWASGLVLLRIKPERRQKLLTALRGVLSKGTLTSGEASSLRGKLYFSCTTAFGKIGRAALQSFIERQYHSTTKLLTSTLIFTLNFFLELLEYLPPRMVELDRQKRPTLLVWSDAMYDMDTRVGRLGFVVYEPETGQFYHSSWIVPQWVFAMFIHKRQYIAQLEILAALAVYFTMPVSMTRFRDILHFIDNSGAISSLLHGTSRKPDNSLLVSVFHLFNAGLQARPYWHWVSSKANIADLPSRGDFDLLNSLGSIWIHMQIPGPEMWYRPLREWLNSFGSAFSARVAPVASSARKRARARANRG